MIRKFKKMICLILAAMLVVMGTSSVFAGEGQGAEGDISLDELLELVSVLTAGSSGEENESTEEPEDIEVVDEGRDTYVIEKVSFTMPEGMTAQTDDHFMMLFSPDFSTTVTAVYAEGEGEDINIRNTDNIDMLLNSLGGEESVKTMEFVEVCGYDALWLEVVISEGDTNVNAFVIVVQLEDAVFSLTEAGIDLDFFEFVKVVESISIEGADGETDLSATFDSDPAPLDENETKPADDVEDPKADVNEEAIDATLVDEVVLIDDDICRISLKDFQEDPDDYYGFKAKVYAENKTDINLYFSFDNVSLNGYMIEPWWGNSVSAGHKTNSDLTFYKSDLEDNNIEDIKDFTFTIKARDDDDWSADYIVNEEFTVLPFGPSMDPQPEQELEGNAIVLVDNEDVTMVITGFDTEDNYYFKAKVYLENKTDIPLEFRVSGTTAINGYEINPYFFCRVQPQKKANSVISWFWEDIEENDIETIEDIEFDINIADADDFWADPMYQDMVRIDF